jgi:hypothetical protein
MLTTAGISRENSNSPLGWEHCHFQLVDNFGLKPDCPGKWCALQNSKVVEGLGPKYGTVLMANGQLQ